MLQPKSPKEKKNTKDATQMKNMKPVFKGPNSKLPMPKNLSGKARNGKPVKKAFLGSLLGGAGGGSMLGGMGKQMLGGLASQALGGLMGGGAGGGRAAAQGGQGGGTQAPMPRKSTDTTPVRTRGMMKKGGKVSKAKSGTSLGMKSVKAGFDKNPGVTRADIITAATKKAQNGVKATKDSTSYFSKKADDLSRSMKNKNLKGDFKGGSKDLKGALGALKDEYRQGNKGQSGYDKNGYRVKKKAKTGASVKKCKYGCN
jgi:hypothetical protein